MATQSLDVTGAVHASGEAYVTIERLHSKSNAPPIKVQGSVHGTGHKSVDVNETRQKVNSLPEPVDDARGFTKMTSGDGRFTGEEIEIERLVIIPERPDVIAGMYNAGYTVYDELRLTGAVHSPGKIEVTIEDLYVF